MLKVSEVFSSMQGEGPAVGQLATFVRFFGCNNRCVFCDSSYAITVKRKEKNCFNAAYYKTDAKELFEEVIHHNPTVVVITGGQPTLQEEDSMLDFVRRLASNNVSIDVETNGTDMFTSWFGYCRYIVVSPKKVSSNLLDYVAWKKKEDRGKLGKLAKKIYFKFIVDCTSKDNLHFVCMTDYVKDFIKDYNLPFYASPKATVPFDVEKYIKSVEILLAGLNKLRSKDSFYNRCIISLQTHKFIWQDKRGK